MSRTLFRPDGSACRATMSANGWLLDVAFEPRQAAPRAAARLTAHELVHVVQQGMTVRGWSYTAKKPIVGTRRLTRSPTSASSFVPEVGDEVLVAFQSAAPRSTALAFNPREYTPTLDNQGTTAARGNVGVIGPGCYTVRVQRRSTASPLTLTLIIYDDPRTRHAAQTIRVL
jgi:hypothetical protein